MAHIGIIGYGIVGQAVGHGFADHTIHFYDKYKKSDPLEAVATHSEFIFVCVPTPMKHDESGIDLAHITDVMMALTPFTDHTNKIIIIKSTVVPGTTAAFAKQYPNSHIAVNPEFLTEANFKDDFVNANRTLIGAHNNHVGKRITDLYAKQFPNTTIVLSDPTTIEMAKYMTNTYLATKVLFANEMFDICENLGIDYHAMKDLVVMDERIYDSHLAVTKERGFGGKCFSKDMVSLIARAKELGADVSLLETTWQKNKKIRKIKDWEM